MNTDWREQGQEKYLKGLEFKKRKYKISNASWEHDHCEFCNAKFCEQLPESDCLYEGYATEDGYRWICENCFNFFKDKYNLIDKTNYIDYGTEKGQDH